MFEILSPVLPYLAVDSTKQDFLRVDRGSRLVALEYVESSLAVLHSFLVLLEVLSKSLSDLLILFVIHYLIWHVVTSRFKPRCTLTQ